MANSILNSHAIQNKWLLAILLGCVLVAGCSEKQNAEVAQTIPKPNQSKPAKTTINLDELRPWETPVRFAVFVSQQIDDAGSKALALTEIALAQQAAGDNEQAVTTLAWAAEANQEVMYAFQRDPHLVEIASATASGGEVNQSLKIADTIEGELFKSAALTRIAAIQVKQGENAAALPILIQAVKLAQMVKEEYYQEFYVWDTAATLLQAGGRDQALAILKQEWQLALKIKDKDLRFSSLRNVASGLSTIGEIEEAVKVSQEIESPWYRSCALRNIASVSAQEGQIDSALKFAHEIENADYKASAFINIASVLLENGDKEQSRKVLGLAFDAAKQSDNAFLQHFRLTENAVAFVESGDIEKAIEVVSLSSALSATTLASAVAKSGNYEAADEVAIHIQDAYGKATARKHILLAQAAGHDEELALSALKELIEIDAKIWKVGTRPPSKLWDMAFLLATKPMQDERNGFPKRKMKETFSQVEKALAEKLVKLGNYKSP
ncbi:hypothetical protein [Symmachiella dynata]|uniref:tetratricopeptide repeat protein n=1 Tax=Symmachiella dynata TaxID=2527995 RepID=UPI0030EB95CB